MSRATPPVALSFREFLVKVLKPENNGVLEWVKKCFLQSKHSWLILSRKQSELLEVGLKASHVPLDNGVLHCFSQARWVTSPSRHQTAQKTGSKEPDFALPSSVCPKLQAWVVPGACWKEWSAWGAKTPRRPPGPYPPLPCRCAPRR